MEKSALTHSIVPVDSGALVAPGFGSKDAWELLQRIGKAFAVSTLVPDAYRDNVSNCIVAVEIAHRMQISPLMVMQNLYIVHGNPAWKTQFLIATFNTCGRFTTMRYRDIGELGTPSQGCLAWAIEKQTNEVLQGSPVSLRMAMDEGWTQRKGNKWNGLMLDQMLKYRAAAFMIRVYAPELSLGFYTQEEAIDMDLKPAMSAQMVRDAMHGLPPLPPAPGFIKAADAVQVPEETGDYVADMLRRIRAIDSRALFDELSVEINDMPEEHPDKDVLIEALLHKDAQLRGEHIKEENDGNPS